MWKLEDFEPLSYLEQLDMLQDILKDEGYKEEIREENKISNHIYTKTDLEYVLIIVRNERNENPSKWQYMAVILDLDCYQKYLDNGARVTLKSRANGLIPVVNNMRIPEKVSLARIHRLVCNVSDPKIEVDHITHNLGIVLREYLRPCSAVKNQYNKIFRSTISKSKYSFSLTVHPSEEELEEYKKKQYQVKHRKKGYTLTSPVFSTEEEMYQAIEEVETYFYKEFRYDPMSDMSKTWYAFMLWKMGLLSADQMNEYQKGYILKYQKETAKYYRLI